MPSTTYLLLLKSRAHSSYSPLRWSAGNDLPCTWPQATRCFPSRRSPREKRIPLLHSSCSVTSFWHSSSANYAAPSSDTDQQRPLTFLAVRGRTRGFPFHPIPTHTQDRQRHPTGPSDLRCFKHRRLKFTFLYVRPIYYLRADLIDIVDFDHRWCSSSVACHLDNLTIFISGLPRIVHQGNHTMALIWPSRDLVAECRCLHVGVSRQQLNHKVGGMGRKA